MVTRLESALHLIAGWPKHALNVRENAFESAQRGMDALPELMVLPHGYLII